MRNRREFNPRGPSVRGRSLVSRRAPRAWPLRRPVRERCALGAASAHPTATQEMGHIEKLADRILFLKGEVEMVASGPVKKITDA
jgi:hypothetical protein